MRQKLVFLSILALSFLQIHCGQRAQRVTSFSKASNFNGDGTSQQATGGVSDTLLPYSTLSPDAEVSKLRDAVGVNIPNQSFASSIQSAAVTQSPISNDDKAPLEVKVKWGTLDQPLVFRGDLQSQDASGFVSEMTETSGQRPDLKIQAQCNDRPCHHGDLMLVDSEGHKAGIIVNKENRTIHMKLPTDENADQIKNTGLAAYQDDRTVEVTSTEIIPGKSTYSIRELNKDPKKPALSIDGALFDPDGEAIPTEGNDVANKLGHISLVGKDQDEMIFRVDEPVAETNTPAKTGGKNPSPTTSPKTAVVYFDLVSNRTPGPTLNPVVSQKCPVHVSGQVHPWVNNVLRDCDRPEIQENIRFWITARKGGRAKFDNFLNLYHESFTAEKSSQKLDFQKMLRVLKQNNFPEIWSNVTLQESSFNWTQTSRVGAIGVWQLMPKTAQGLGITPQQAREIIPATQAAVKYFKSLTHDWGDNTKMLLASYDGGNRKKRIEKRGVYSSDFWELCRVGMLDRKETCPYVPRIEAAMIVSLDPKAYGVTEVGPMEAR